MQSTVHELRVLCKVPSMPAISVQKIVNATAYTDTKMIARHYEIYVT